MASAQRTQIEVERKAVTLDFVDQAYPPEHWKHAYADGSAEEATRNGGGGIYISLNDETTIQQAIPTGKLSTNCKAKVDTL